MPFALEEVFLKRHNIMYTWEIEKKLKESNYNISVADYINICNSSPQISRCRYDPFYNNFQLWADNKCYTFVVHR